MPSLQKPPQNSAKVAVPKEGKAKTVKSLKPVEKSQTKSSAVAAKTPKPITELPSLDTARAKKVVEPQEKAPKRAKKASKSQERKTAEAEKTAVTLPTLAPPVAPPKKSVPTQKAPVEEEAISTEKPTGPVITLSEPAPVPRREPPPSTKRGKGQANIIPLSPVVDAPTPNVPRPVRQVVPKPMTNTGTVSVDSNSARNMRRERYSSDNSRQDRGKKGKRGQNHRGTGHDRGGFSHRNRGRKGDRNRGATKSSVPVTAPRKEEKKIIKITDTIVVSELAKSMGVKAADVLRKLISQGMMVTLNQTLDFDTASLIAGEFGWEVINTTIEPSTILKLEEDNPEDQKMRWPVVTIMGHVDHGKTTLLDALRKTDVAGGEAGGITQHIGAYQVSVPRGKVVFLDTPGHEAFTQMRARGAEVTDIVVLVVAADDGVKPQTVEAIQHAKAAKVPIMVAINKIDKEGADPSRVKTALMEHEVIGEEFGGDVIMVPVSAKEGTNLDQLIESLLLQSEILELKANHNKNAYGIVIESRLDRGRGSVATVLVSGGTLRVGDAIVCGRHYGKVRALYDDRGRTIEEAGPSTPVEVIGFSAPPSAGEEVHSVEDESVAKKVADFYEKQARAAEQAAELRRRSAGPLIPVPGEEETKVLPIVLKTDVQGSLEAVRNALENLSTEKVKVDIILAGVGGITESDVNLASTANASVIGFNVRTAGKSAQLAEQENVEIRYHNIIYEAVKDTKAAMTGILEPKFVEKTLGRAEVRQLFHVPKVGTIAGCVVSDGKMLRNSQLRLLRDSVEVYNGRFSSLRRFKDDVREVAQGYECGIGIENFNDIKVGDIIEAYEEEKIAPTL